MNLDLIKLKEYRIYSGELSDIDLKVGKKVINTINAHSYIVAKKDKDFKKALTNSDVLLPDGEGIVFMAKQLQKTNIKKIAGADIHEHLLALANSQQLKCFYLGASQDTLNLINKKLTKSYNNIEFGFYSPPFKSKFTNSDNIKMIDKINSFNADIVFVGMTAPKQEKWVYNNKDKINAKAICSIGAVFDFVSETKKRAPQWVINLKLEWLYRSFTAWRLTKRYMYSTPLFLLEIYKLKYFSK